MACIRKVVGELELDDARGVVYFHSSTTGRTLLRIQGLPHPLPPDGVMMDVKVGVCSPSTGEQRVWLSWD